MFQFLILLNKIFLIFICRKIINTLNTNNKREILFLILSFSTISLASFYDHVTVFHERMFLFLIFLLLVIQITISKERQVITSLILGFFSLLSILFYWDIGTYTNLLLLLFLVNLFFVKKYHNLLIIIFSVILSWSIFCIFLEGDEVKEFFNQYIFIINISDYLLGIEYPTPFSDKSTRHTKALLLIILSGVFLVNFIMNTSNKENLNSKFILFFILYLR